MQLPITSSLFDSPAARTARTTRGINGGGEAIDLCPNDQRRPWVGSCWSSCYWRHAVRQARATGQPSCSATASMVCVLPPPKAVLEGALGCFVDDLHRTFGDGNHGAN